jgi:chromosome partitioning protein
MTVPVLTFFNNKGGVGKTSLVYHLAWMLSEIGHRVLACDLDPQANLSAAFLDEDRLETLWSDDAKAKGATIYGCLEPLVRVGDWEKPKLQDITRTLKLIPGDLALSGFEDRLSREWPETMGSADLFRPFRIVTAFWSIMQAGADAMNASIILVDVGPNLGAINRSTLIATDCVVVPLAADLFSLQGLRNLGPTLKSWRGEWAKRQDNWTNPEFKLPAGRMSSIGYVVQQHSIRLDRPVKAYDKWIKRIPEEYATRMLESKSDTFPDSPDEDENCLATLKHYRSLVPMAQEARKPIFRLTAADGAIGSHARAVADARVDFHRLAVAILARVVSKEEEYSAQLA